MNTSRNHMQPDAFPRASGATLKPSTHITPLPMKSSLHSRSGRLGRMFSPLLVGLLAVVASSSFAADYRPVFQASFTDKEGTSLKSVKNQPAALRWSADIPGVATTGKAKLRVRMAGDVQGAAGMSYIPLNKLVKPTDRLWLIVEVGGWHFEGVRDEFVRIGFMHSNKGDRPAPLAQFRLSRNSKGVQIAGEAFNKQQGATMIPTQQLGGVTQDERVILALEYVPAENSYAIYRHVSGERFELLGSGKTSTTRKPNFLRIAFEGDFASSENEFFDLERVLLMSAP